MLKDTEQTSRKYRIAAFNQRLHQNGICPANHSVEYAYGWYYFDGEPRRKPGLTRRAKEIEEAAEVRVFYNSSYNTYTLSYVTDRVNPPVTVQGEVAV